MYDYVNNYGLREMHIYTKNIKSRCLALRTADFKYEILKA